MLASVAFYTYWRERHLFPDRHIIVNYFVAKNWEGCPKSAQNCSSSSDFSEFGPADLLKYFDFLQPTSRRGRHQLRCAHIVMPIGISFFTFTNSPTWSTAFEADLRAISSPTRCSSGLSALDRRPDHSHAQMRPQFARLRRDPVDATSITMGMVISWSSRKKVLLATTWSAGNLVFNAADHGAHLSTASAWIAPSPTRCKFLRFFRYSIWRSARAAVRVVPAVNFNSPYKSTSSLILAPGTFHFPLAAHTSNPALAAIAEANLRACATCSSHSCSWLWHGAGWTSSCWGALHGAYSRGQSP